MYVRYSVSGLFQEIGPDEVGHNIRWHFVQNWCVGFTERKPQINDLQSLPSPRSINNRDALSKEAQNYQVSDYWADGVTRTVIQRARKYEYISFPLDEFKLCYIQESSDLLTI